MKYDWITFDCYGTLVDWEEGMKEPFRRILAAHSLPEDVSALPAKYIQYELWVERRPYMPYRGVLAASTALLFKQEFGVELTADESQELGRALPQWKPFPEVAEVLQRLKKKYRLAVLSNIDDDLLAATLPVLGVEFDLSVTAEQVRTYKPIKNHWQEALRRFGVTEDRVFHVAASYLHDIMPAKQLGIDCAWINRKNEKAIGVFEPDVTFPDLKPLPDYLGA
jgi:2-haloacid dehalogenase